MSDLIDRQKAIDTLSFFKERLNHHLGETDFREEQRAWGLSLIQYCMDFIRQMPSAEPERKMGRWIRHPEQANIYGGKCIECSKCGEKYVVSNIKYEKYCRNCGAKMEDDDGK